MQQPVQELVRLIGPDSQRLIVLTIERAHNLMRSEDPTALCDAQSSLAWSATAKIST